MTLTTGDNDDDDEDVEDHNYTLIIKKLSWHYHGRGKLQLFSKCFSRTQWTGG